MMIRTLGTLLEVSIPLSEPQLNTDMITLKPATGKHRVSPGSMGNRFGLGVILRRCEPRVMGEPCPVKESREG